MLISRSFFAVEGNGGHGAVPRTPDYRAMVRFYRKSAFFSAKADRMDPLWRKSLKNSLKIVGRSWSKSDTTSALLGLARFHRGITCQDPNKRSGSGSCFGTLVRHMTVALRMMMLEQPMKILASGGAERGMSEG